MILCIRTDTPIAHIALVDASTKNILSEKKWEAGRSLASTLLSEIDKMLRSRGANPRDLSGVIVFKGPGSFTGLRIGLTVANATAYANAVPIIGVGGEEWMRQGLERIKKIASRSVVLPEYGAEANITL